jgi:hypothetical protein
MKIETILAAGIALAATCTNASAESLSARSGKTGEVVAEARVDSGNDLRGLMILEQSDRPCVVQVYGDLASIGSYEGRIDKCKGGGPTKADGIDSTKGQVFVVGGGSFVTGLKVCLSSSDRVKGWTLYGESSSSPNTVSDSFKRPNCPNDGWQARVDCPNDTKAIGVHAYFEPGTGNNSDMLRGMQLICD